MKSTLTCFKNSLRKSMIGKNVLKPTQLHCGGRSTFLLLTHAQLHRGGRSTFLHTPEIVRHVGQCGTQGSSTCSKFVRYVLLAWHNNIGQTYKTISCWILLFAKNSIFLPQIWMTNFLFLFTFEFRFSLLEGLAMSAFGFSFSGVC